jgi:hypothetical protein
MPFKLALGGVSALVILAAGLALAQNPPINEPPISVQLAGGKAWMAEHLDRNLSEVSRRADKVRVVTTGLFLSTVANPSNPKQFDLAIGESFYQQDRHGRITFTVKEVKNSAVVLDYVSRFDLRSFERHPGTKAESGLIEIAYR